MDRTALLHADKTKEQLGLEIGPYFQPLFPKKDNWNVRSVDVYDTQELIERGQRDPLIGPNYTNIEPVDYIYKGSLLEAVAENATPGEKESLDKGEGMFDYIVSSHNFEHQPNPVQFLLDCSSLLKVGGSLTMAIPIGTRCFDRMRPLSTTGQMIDAFLKKSAKPSAGQMIDHFLNSVADSGSNTPIHHHQYSEDQLVMTLATKEQKWNPEFLVWSRLIAESEHYVDAHCWVMNRFSLLLILEDLSRLGVLTQLKGVSSWDLGSEFIINIQKHADASEDDPNRCALSADANHYYASDMISLKP